MKPQARHDARQLVILTGLSGSGKSTVLHAFEDMGFYCVDNLPVELIPIFAELHAAGEGDFAILQHMRRFGDRRGDADILLDDEDGEAALIELEHGVDHVADDGRRQPG